MVGCFWGDWVDFWFRLDLVVSGWFFVGDAGNAGDVPHRFKMMLGMLGMQPVENKSRPSSGWAPENHGLDGPFQTKDTSFLT